MHPSAEEIVQQINGEFRTSRKIVFVSGNFNIVHPGHLRLLRFAAECGDFLVVGVNQQNKDAHLSEELRLEGVKSVSLVNLAFVLKEGPEDFIARLKPDVVVKGKEHEDAVNPEQGAVDSFGGKLLFSSGEVRFSSLDLLRKELVEPDLSSIIKPIDFQKRHGFNEIDLKNVIARFKDLRVTVVGDLIVDEYVACDPLGMSQEEPVIVVTPVHNDLFIGGAGIVAAHARGLGARTRFISLAGSDEVAQYALQKLKEYKVEATIFLDESRPTTLKQRYRTGGRTLFRVSHLRQHAASKDFIEKMSAAVHDSLDDTDLLIFSDFNYGCLPQHLVDSIRSKCIERGIMMVADSQSSSQVGDISRFNGMLLMTPTEREARLALRDFDSGLVVLAEALRRKSHTQNVIITLGSEGLLIHAADSNADSFATDRLPAMNTSPKDVAGAGDSFLTCSSMALAVGADIWKSCYLGGIAAACQVGRLGNVPLSTQDLANELA